MIFGHISMNRIFKHIIFILFVMILFMPSCIEPYIMQIGNDDMNKYIVSGQLTDQEGYQYVSVSLGSSISDPDFIPLQDCEIKIIDNIDNEFALEEHEAGMYRVWIDQQYLNPGTAYRLSILTPAMASIESDFDKMPECPEVDSVYYINEDIATYDPENPIKGIQFYIDVQGNEQQSRYSQVSKSSQR